LAIARKGGDRRDEGVRLGCLGAAYARLGQAEKAVGCYGEALAIARELGDRQDEGNTLGNMGLAYVRLGRTGEAITVLVQASEIGREINDPVITNTTTRILNRLGARADS
jgi:tetratricopeptide (TPR) repeat protein